MSNKETYTSDEWSLLRSTPTFVAGGVAAADPGGIFSAIKEALAGAGAYAEFATKHPESEFFRALTGDKSIPAMPDPQSLLGQGDPAQQATNFQHAVLARVKDAVAVVAQKGTLDEVAEYKEMVNSVAETVANASTEGGFLGFGGVRVSEKETSFLAALAAAIAEVPAPALTQPAAAVAPGVAATSGA
jgi:hypothetical protein